MKREIAHVHGGNDHSLHVVLAPADCMYPVSCEMLKRLVLMWNQGKRIIESGWGQRHAFSGSSAMKFLSLGTRPDIPAEYILIYAPRTEAEIETVMHIVSASIKFMTGREDVR